MASITNTHPHLVDLSRLAGDARPTLDWFEWYADSERQALDPEAIAELVAALDQLVAYTALDGPV